MNKIIIVHYANMDDVPTDKIYDTLTELCKRVVNDDEIYSYIVPVFKEPTRIECINPQLLDDTQYEKVRLQLNKISKIYEESC